MSFLDCFCSDYAGSTPAGPCTIPTTNFTQDLTEEKQLAGFRRARTFSFALRIKHQHQMVHAREKDLLRQAGSVKRAATVKKGAKFHYLLGLQMPLPSEGP
jgi:hypothetical protein